MSAAKWTPDLRRRLYTSLLHEFGPHSQWGGAYEPLRHKDRFAAVLEELAAEFSSTTGKPFKGSAVRQQLNFAVTSQTEVDFPDSSHKRTLRLNKIAAREAGLI
jgi:hypothetical protein